jgi:hypothetical protein
MQSQNNKYGIKGAFEFLSSYYVVEFELIFFFGIVC